MKENNILYITWGEVIIENGIFKNQVLEQLKLIKKEILTIEFTNSQMPDFFYNYLIDV